MKRRGFSLILVVLLWATGAFAQLPYELGDWTSYRDCRYARALDAGAHELFVATSGGILEYELLRHRWRQPMVIGYGITEAVELDDPVLILYDEATGYLWVATRTQWLQYDAGSERWRRVGRVNEGIWSENERVVNIGVGGDYIYVETVPADVYPRLYAGLPLPHPGWYVYATRYRGQRTFGSLMVDVDPQEPSDTRWRGLRSHLPLQQEDLFGALPLPPIGFPALIMPSGWVWQSDGTLLDPYLRAAPVTDWMVDRYGRLWATFWGAGILEADLRTSVAEFHQFGPAGNDVRTLGLTRNHTWMGGFNDGDRLGITRADASLETWQFFERRDDPRLRSTSVFDIAEWGNRMWFASDDGLLSFEQKGSRWQLYTVNQNLFDNQVRALAASDSELWIGTTRGLCVMTAPGRVIWRVTNEGLELNGISDLALCGDTLYAATPSGLYKGNIHSRKFRFAPLDPGLLNAPVLEISVVDSEVWLATAEGIQRYNWKTGESKSWNSEIWLEKTEPSCILATEKFVWVGTRASGFFRFSRKSGEWIRYSTADGLVDNRVQIIRQDGDDLLIGTATGLTRFYWNRPHRTR